MADQRRWALEPGSLDVTAAEEAHGRPELAFGGRSPSEVAMSVASHGAVGGGLAGWSDWASAHKAEHTPEQLNAFEQAFMEQVEIGDRCSTATGHREAARR